VPKQTKDKGIYVLELHFYENIRIEHKRFSQYLFPTGYYYYIGSAQKNLQKRIKRHILKTKKLHWHIDYLTSLNNTRIENVFIFPELTKDNECKIVDNLETKFNLEHKIIGFGNSDCNICKSHLLFSKKRISYNQLFSLYQSTVLFIPSASDIC